MRDAVAIVDDLGGWAVGRFGGAIATAQPECGVRPGERGGDGARAIRGCVVIAQKKQNREAGDCDRMRVLEKCWRVLATGCRSSNSVLEGCM